MTIRLSPPCLDEAPAMLHRTPLAVTSGCVDTLLVHDVTWRIIDADLVDRVDVRLVAAVDAPEACAECPPESPVGRIPADATVWHGHSRPIYRTSVCESHLPRVLRRYIGHDHARPVVEIPGVAP